MGGDDMHTIAIRPQDALDFSVCLVVADVFHHVRRKDDIEGGVVERDMVAIVIDDRKHARLRIVGIGNLDCGNVDTSFGEIERLMPSARANLEHQCARSEEGDDLIDLCCAERMQVLYREHTISPSGGQNGEDHKGSALEHDPSNLPS
jgi:hypothetical protein